MGDGLNLWKVGVEPKPSWIREAAALRNCPDDIIWWHITLSNELRLDVPEGRYLVKDHEWVCIKSNISDISRFGNEGLSECVELLKNYAEMIKTGMMTGVLTGIDVTVEVDSYRDLIRMCFERYINTLD